MKFASIMFLILTPLALPAQQTATLDNGKKVLLNADGTWVPIGEKTDGKLPDFTFRRTYWGMTKLQARESESATFLRESDAVTLTNETDILAFTAKVSGMDALIMYIFVDNKLVRARYSFTEKRTDLNDYLNEYKSINVALAEKYGESKSDIEHWVNEQYKESAEQRGLAVSMGHLKFYREWETASTSIISALTGSEGKTQLITEYASKKLKELEKNKKKKTDF